MDKDKWLKIKLAIFATIVSIAIGYDIFYSKTQMITSFLFAKPQIYILTAILLVLVVIAKWKETKELGQFWLNKVDYQTGITFFIMNLLDVMTTILFMKAIGINAEFNGQLKWALNTFGFSPIVFFVDFIITTAIMIGMCMIVPKKADGVLKWTFIISKAYIVMHNLMY
jgi:hypothetical protein